LLLFCLAYSLTLKMEVVYPSETSVNVYQAMWWKSQKMVLFLSHCSENLKSNMMKSLLVLWPETLMLGGTWLPWLLSVTSIFYSLSCAHSHLHGAQSVHKMNGSLCWSKEIAVSSSHNAVRLHLGPGKNVHM
jgi:hypothetical protein